MRSTEKIRNDAIVIFPEGKLSIHAVLVLEELMNLAIEQNPGCHVLVDLQDAEYISSSCLRLFVTVHDKLSKSGLKLRLYNPNEINKKILGITELDKHISVYDTREQALESLARE